MMTPEQLAEIRERAKYDPPLDESAYEGSGFEYAVGDVNALLKDREAIAEQLVAISNVGHTLKCGLNYGSSRCDCGAGVVLECVTTLLNDMGVRDGD